MKAPRQLPLNTARGWQSRANRAEGSVAPDALDEMISQGAVTGTITILVCHHPFNAFSGAGLTTRTRRTWSVSPPGSGAYIALSAGTLSLRLRTSPPGSNIVDVDPGSLSVSPYACSHETFERPPSTRLDWTEAPDPG